MEASFFAPVLSFDSGGGIPNRLENFWVFIILPKRKIVTMQALFKRF